MIKKAIAISSLILLLGCTPTYYCSTQSGPYLTSINITDRNGLTETISTEERLCEYENVDFNTSHPFQKVVRVYGRDEQGDTPAKITTYHENGQIKQYLEVVNSRAQGRYLEWHSNGALKLSSYVVGGVADITGNAQSSWLFSGKSEAFDEVGKKVAEITYEKGVLSGTSSYFYPSGALQKQIPYQNGNVEGTMISYYENGDVLEKITYKKDQKDGQAARFWETKTPAYKEKYQNDLLLEGVYYNKKEEELSRIEQGNGKRILFDLMGALESHEYKNGVTEGEVFHFNTNGEITRKYSLFNGLKHGEELIYPLTPTGHAQKNPKISVQWYEGKIQGIVKTWYDNGILESQREMSNNQKQGILSAWYRDGSLMMLEEYHQDRLVKGDYFRSGDKTPVSRVREKNGIATLYDANGNFKQKIIYEEGKPSHS